MKSRMLLSAGLLLTLAACGSERTLTVGLLIHDTDPSRTVLLMESATRVMERRLAAAGVKNSHATALPRSPMSAEMTVKVPDEKALAAAKAIVAEPFFFDIRLEKPKTDPTSPKPADWIPTALTGSSLTWVQALGNKSNGDVSIELQFTPAGKEILSAIFKGNQGKHVGIFVRDLLVSKLTIQSTSISDRVMISGIPSSKVAEIFADDVNVGLKVTFTPAS